MTIHLPADLESSIRDEVSRGHFATVDEAVTEAVRLLLRDRNQAQPPPAGTDVDPVIGSMRDAADELDEIVADAYRKRREETWRDISVE